MMEAKSGKENGPDEGELVGYCCSELLLSYREKTTTFTLQSKENIELHGSNKRTDSPTYGYFDG